MPVFMKRHALLSTQATTHANVETQEPQAPAAESTKATRLKICAECPEKIVSTVPIIDVELDRCGKCGCLLATRVYTSCPIGKW